MADETPPTPGGAFDPQSLVRPQVVPEPAPTFEPMPTGGGLSGLLSTLLRHPGKVIYQLHQPNGAWLTLALATIAVACLALYGLLVGNFSGEDQLWAAPLKIVVGTTITALICLPSLYVFGCLSGVDDRVRLGALFGMVVAALALEGLLLLSFAPVAWVFSESTYSVAFIGALHLMFWAVGLFFGLRLVRAGIRYLHADNVGYLSVWIVIFVLVSLQMMTALRPLVGRSPDFLPKEKKFFLTHWAEVVDSEVMPSSRSRSSSKSAYSVRPSDTKDRPPSAEQD